MQSERSRSSLAFRRSGAGRPQGCNMKRERPGPQMPISGPSRRADPTTAWARDVVAGRIVAGDIVRHAAERHLHDLKDGPGRGLHWRPERAAHAFGFFPAVLSITEGAAVGEPFH